MQLRKTHRDFFVVLLGTLIFYVWEAFGHLSGRADGSFTLPALYYVAQIGNPSVWGVAFAVAAGILSVSMWRTRTFHVARAGLALGMIICGLRFVLLVRAGDAAITGAPTWFFVCMVHAAAVMEPPVNPATSR